MKLYSRFALALFLGTVFFGVLMMHTNTVSAASTDKVSGWAWSSNIGWIDLNSENDTDPDTAGIQSSSVPFGVSISSVTPSTTGTMSGYAWSSTIGWISFNNNDCPMTDCTAGARITWAADGTGVMTGWAQACSVYVSGCTGAKKVISGTELGGWDGYIELGGYNTTDGVKIKADGTMSGYAWGSEVIGWADFSGAKISLTPVTVPVVTLTASPNPVTVSGDQTTLSWTVLNGATSCVASDGNANWLSPSTQKSPTGGAQSGIQITATTTFTLTCTNPSGSGSAQVTVTILGTPPPATYACSDGIDNDSDGQIDHPSDLGCTSSTDTDETNSGPVGSCTTADNANPAKKACYCAVPANKTKAVCKIKPIYIER